MKLLGYVASTYVMLKERYPHLIAMKPLAYMTFICVVLKGRYSHLKQ